MERLTITMTAADAEGRLDKALATHLPAYSRSRLQQLIAQGCVTLEGAIITDASAKVKPGDRYLLTLPQAAPTNLVATSLPFGIVFEDENMLVVDKPAGMTVHPAPGHSDDTLVNALLAHCGASLSGIGGVMRPGIVHRIDKDTSGLLVVAKHDVAHRHLAAQLADHTLKRQYIAFVKGIPRPPSGTIHAAIARSPTNRKKMAVVKRGGKDAITHYTTEATFGDVARIRCILETGRTHQIRVHLTHIGHPLIGDPVYGRQAKLVLPRQALHATALTLVHPQTSEIMEFSSPLPADLLALQTMLEGA